MGAYQAKRGGRVVFQDIAKPSNMEWGTLWKQLKLLLSWRRQSTKVLLTSTRLAMAKVMLIFVILLKQSSWVNKLKESRSLETGSPRSSALEMDLAFTSWTRKLDPNWQSIVIFQ